MTIRDLITPKCGETWIYKKYKQMKEKTVVTLLMEELDAEMKMGTKMVLNWDKYLEMEKEQIVKAGNSCGLKSKLYHERIKDMSTDELGIEIDKPSITFGEEYYNETYGSGTPELRYKDGTPMRKYNSPKLQEIENELSTQKEMSDDLLTEEEIAEFKRELKEVMKKPKTEISDEEIENEAERYEKVDGVNSFKEAIKWYREQLKSKQ